MNPSDKHQFGTIVLSFAELRGKTLSTPAVELFWNAMQDWDITEFTRAAEHLLKSSQFMPTPYDFEQLRKAATRPTAGEAWSKACAYCRSAIWSDLRSSTATCGEPLIDRAVHMIGGYEALGLCETDKLGFRERSFIEHYEALQDVTEVRQALPQLTSALRVLPAPNGKADR